MMGERKQPTPYDPRKHGPKPEPPPAPPLRGMEIQDAQIRGAKREGA
jgi:hypothetical protein